MSHGDGGAAVGSAGRGGGGGCGEPAGGFPPAEFHVVRCGGAEGEALDDTRARLLLRGEVWGVGRGGVRGDLGSSEGGFLRPKFTL